MYTALPIRDALGKVLGVAAVYRMGRRTSPTHALMAGLVAATWFELVYFAGRPLTGDLVTPSHTDNLTGYQCCGAPSVGRTVVRRDTQSVKLERYVARSGVTHTLQSGLQFEDIGVHRLKGLAEDIALYRVRTQAAR